MKIQGNDIRVSNIDFQTMLSHKEHKKQKLKTFPSAILQKKKRKEQEVEIAWSFAYSRIFFRVFILLLVLLKCYL